MSIKRYSREQILIKKEAIDFEQFDNKSLSEFIEYFTELKKLYNAEFPDYEPTVTIYHYGYDGGADFVLNVYKPEPDEVYKTRVAKLEYANKMAEDKILKKERKVYELLKKKFENNG